MPLKQARLRISDYNEKRKSRIRKQEKRILMVSLSLTSMVDMFAILVIFLLANSSSVSQWIEVSHGIELPKAKHADPPQKAATIQISDKAIYGDKQILTSLTQVGISSDGGTIGAVHSWLSKRSKAEKKSAYVNIVAHHKVPFGVIKRIIATCQESGFRNVNLAVEPRG